VDLQQLCQFIREMCAPLRLAAREGGMFRIMGVRQVIHLGQQRTEIAAMADDAADRQAAPAHAVIGAGTGDEADAARFAAGAVITAGDLQCGVDGF
jgi:hypothetical protein